jgi:preprotein translocase subunit SecD
MFDYVRGSDEGGQKIPVKKQVSVGGEHLTDAQAETDPQTGEIGVSLRFNNVGSRKFAEISANNIGKQFAIVLDDKVITAPVFRSAIPNGKASISGGFRTIKEANELALLLRAGSLPAPLKVVEERTVGPSLGADSINSGKHATIIAFLLVSVFMFMGYSLFGLFANIALAFNMILLFAGLSLLQATLTLPGIAGIAMTIGMAVDANVLIYERIKEEIRHGTQNMLAIEAGFDRAMTTIIDSNLTTLIAAAALYEFGSGPIRGFAVTTALGITVSMFTALSVTKLVCAWWFKNKSPEKLPI